MGLRLEQTAVAQWVKSEGWDCIVHHLEQDGLLQHIVDMGGGASFMEAMLPRSRVPCRWRIFTILSRELKKMGDAHKACGIPPGVCKDEEEDDASKHAR